MLLDAGARSGRADAWVMVFRLDGCAGGVPPTDVPAWTTFLVGTMSLREIPGHVLPLPTTTTTATTTSSAAAPPEAAPKNELPNISARVHLEPIWKLQREHCRYDTRTCACRTAYSRTRIVSRGDGGDRLPHVLPFTTTALFCEAAASQDGALPKEGSAGDEKKVATKGGTK